MMNTILGIGSLLAVCALPAAALDLPKGAVSDGPILRNPDSYALPIGAWNDGLVPTDTFEGRVIRQAWRVPVAGVTTLQLVAPLRDQLTADGFEIVFDCDATTCGGFDFRFSIYVLPAPQMFVDLARFRFLAAVKNVGGARTAVSILASRDSAAGYVQIVQAGDAAQQIGVTTAASAVTPVTGQNLGEALEINGRYILTDLTFETGSSSLGQGPFGSLRSLSDYLKAKPDRRVYLVGHTDSTGSPDANIALGKGRAGSVRTRLIETYKVPEGRKSNRRVEVILMSAE